VIVFWLIKHSIVIFYLFLKLTKCDFLICILWSDTPLVFFVSH